MDWQFRHFEFNVHHRDGGSHSSSVNKNSFYFYYFLFISFYYLRQLVSRLLYCVQINRVLCRVDLLAPYVNKT